MPGLLPDAAGQPSGLLPMGQGAAPQWPGFLGGIYNPQAAQQVIDQWSAVPLAQRLTAGMPSSQPWDDWHNQSLSALRQKQPQPPITSEVFESFPMWGFVGGVSGGKGGTVVDLGKARAAVAQGKNVQALRDSGYTHNVQELSNGYNVWRDPRVAEDWPYSSHVLVDTQGNPVLYGRSVEDLLKRGFPAEERPALGAQQAADPSAAKFR